MGKRIKWLLAAIALIGVGCATAPTGSSTKEVLSQSPAQIAEKVRLEYDSGFNRLSVQLRVHAENSLYDRLQLLAKFRQEWVRYAELDGSEYRALESGYTDGAWIVVVPPGHEALGRMKATLEVRIESRPALSVLLIKPESISELWAGIFLVHELSHLMDYVYRVEPARPTREQFLQGELRAYQVELLAASLLSRGMLEQQMDQLLGKWRPSSHAELVEKVRNMDVSERASLDKSMASPDPASNAEHRLRAGFYVMALALRFSSTQSDGQRELLKTIDRLYSSE